MSNKNILVIGGGGFIGSNLVGMFVSKGHHVTVIDGFLKRTGGQIKNLSPYLSKIEFINRKVEDVSNLTNLIANQDIIIDSMAWTAHRLALSDPFYDLNLNVSSHLYFIDQLIKCKIRPKLIIYIGSIGQYGNPRTKIIDEKTSMLPTDIQGIHKLTSENYYRIYSKINQLNTISLRIPNCFGPGQLTDGEDIGLIGSFIRDSLRNKTISIYGKNRKRNVLYVDDLSEIIYQLCKINFKGFSTFNIAGHEIKIEELVKTILVITKKGDYINKNIPIEIKNIDLKYNKYDDNKIKSTLQNYKSTSIEKAIYETVKYFKKELYDLEM